MENPWLHVRLDHYEGHMQAEGVEQLAALSELFRGVLERNRPRSVAVLGIAGGNGLEHIDRSVVRRVVGIDVNAEYLDRVRERYGALDGLELVSYDLSERLREWEPVELAHAALIFEHAGVGACLDNAVALVAPGGVLSIVLQMPSAAGPAVAQTHFTSMERLRPHFAHVDHEWLTGVLQERGMQREHEEMRPLPGGKAFWLGLFRKHADTSRS